MVIVSVGGYPKDIDFIQTHKALEHAKHAAKDGGTIILLGQCADGIGNPYFMPWFDYPSIEAMEPAVRQATRSMPRPPIRPASRRKRSISSSSRTLREADVRKMGMTPKRTLDEALSTLDRGKEILCHVMPEGSKTLVREQS